MRDKHHFKFHKKTTYKLWWESNKVEQTGRDQHHAEFPNDNQTTYLLWIKEEQDNRQRSVAFWILQWTHLQAMNKMVTAWTKRQRLEPFWILKWWSDHLHPVNESNGVKQPCRYQHHFEFPKKITYKLWMKESQGWTTRQKSAPFWILQWQSDHLLAMNERTTG